MKDRIGTTRRGIAIEIYWDFFQGRRIALSITDFLEERDDFDAIVVAIAKSTDGALSEDPVAQYDAAEIGEISDVRLKRFGSERFFEIAEKMGLSTALELRRYGQSLYYPRLFGPNARHMGK